MAVSVCLDLLLLLMVLVAAGTDLAARRIPNRLLLSGIVGAFALHLCAAAPVSAVAGGIAGALTGLLLFLPLYCLRGMAAGDVKLLAAVGAFSAPGEVLQVAVWAVCAGGVMALVVVAVKGRLRDAVTNLASLLRPLLMRIAGMPAAVEPLRAPSVGAIPYGLAIACGALLVTAQKYA